MDSKIVEHGKLKNAYGYIIKEDNFEEISQEEYVSAWNKMYAEAEEQSRRESEAMAEAEKTYTEQLEAENAALLFQVLTGEEYSDV